MTENNSMGVFEYIFNNVLWSLAGMIWYRVILFIPLDGLTAGASKKILWILIAVTVLIGICITICRRCNYLSLMINVLLPFEIYALVSYSSLFGTRIKVTVIVAAVLALLFFSLVVFRRIPQRNKASVVRKRLRHALLGSRTIIVICLCTFIIPFVVNAFVGRDLYQAHNGDVVVLNELDEWTIKNNMNTILKIKPDTWETLTIEERLEVLSVLKNIEMRNLGINHEIYLSADTLSEVTLGGYIQNERKIILNITHLKDSSVDEVVHTLVHECHHAYSRQQVAVYNSLPDEYKNMMLFNNAKRYKEEYANYVHGEDDYYLYATQYCEIHADLYADKAVADYYEAIYDYENKDHTPQNT